MNAISKGISQTGLSATQARSAKAPSVAEEAAPIDPWGSDRVELSSGQDGMTLQVSSGWRDVYEIHGPRGVRTICSGTRPIPSPGEVVRGTPFSVGPAGSPLCR
jgi:hypothetical protein